jgi:hypothetical protein
LPFLVLDTGVELNIKDEAANVELVLISFLSLFLED